MAAKNIAGTETLHIQTRSLSLAIIIISGSSSAQSVEKLSEQAKHKVTEHKIEEILVTAQKREENILDVPQAVSAFSQSDLESLQAGAASDLQFHVPNLTYSDTTTGAPNLTIRGVGSASRFTGADVGVGVHINDVYVNSGSLGGALFDVQQVLVLRGPQGTLYGRNSTGGAINIITNRPESEFEGYLDVTVGSFDYRSVQGVINLPISDSARFRLAGYYSESDGHVRNMHSRNHINGDGVYILRPTISLDISDRTTVEIIGNILSQNDDSLGYDKIGCRRDDESGLGCLADSLGQDIPNYLASIDGVGLDAAGIVAADPFLDAVNPKSRFETNIDLEPETKNKLTDISIHITHEFDELSLTSISSVLDLEAEALRDSDNLVGTTLFAEPVTLSALSSDLTGAPGGNVFGVYDRAFGYNAYEAGSRQYLQELRLASDSDGSHNFLVGLFYMDFESESRYVQATTGLDAYGEVLSEFGIASKPQFIYDENDGSTVKSFAGFGEYYYQHTPELKFTVGARLTRDEKQIKHRRLAFSRSADEPLAGTGIDDAMTFKAFTGRLVVDWSPELSYTDSTLVYASLSKGFRAGGFNPPGDFTESPTYDPEDLYSLEIGTKNTFFGSSGQMSLTAFVYDYRNFQASHDFVFNVDAEVWGLEGEYEQYWTDNLSTNMAFSYLHTNVKSGSAINPRDPTAGNRDFVALGDIQAANCIVDRALFESPVPEGGFGGDPFYLARNLLLCDTAELEAGLQTDLAGKEFPNAPEWTASVGVQYLKSFSKSAYVLARLDYYWQSKFYGRIFNDGADEVDVWNVLNAFLQLGSSEAQSYYIRFSASNLLNKEFTTGMKLRGRNEGLGTELFSLEPRSFKATVGYQF
jgi:iron complex outermembrane receptor protein